MAKFIVKIPAKLKSLKSYVTEWWWSGIRADERMNKMQTTIQNYMG